MSARTRLSPNKGRRHGGCVVRILKHTQRIPCCGEKLGNWRLLRPRKAGRGGRLPLKRRRGVPMAHFNEGHKVRVVAIIILHQYSIVLQTDNCDPVAEILCEGCDRKAERGAWA